MTSPEAHSKYQKQLENQRLFKDILRVVIIVVVFALMAYLFKLPVVKDYFDIEMLREYLHPAGTLGERLFGYFIFVTVFGFLMSFGFFRWMTCVLAGMIYGASLGIVLSMCSSLLGAYGTYVLSSSLLHGVAERRLKGGRVEKLKHLLKDNAFMGTLYMRLFPASNAVVTGVICGSCRIRMAPYTLANFLGFLPQTTIFCIFGSSARKANVKQFVLGILVFLLIMVAQWVAMRWLRKWRRDPHEPSESTEATIQERSSEC